MDPIKRKLWHDLGVVAAALFHAVVRLVCRIFYASDTSHSRNDPGLCYSHLN